MARPWDIGPATLNPALGAGFQFCGRRQAADRRNGAFWIEAKSAPGSVSGDGDATLLPRLAQSPALSSLNQPCGGGPKARVSWG